MQHGSLKAFLAAEIDRVLGPAEPAGLRTPGRQAHSYGMRAPAKSGGEQIADELVRQAFASNLPFTNQSTDHITLSGGNTADLVRQINVHAPFVFKLDKEKQKLAAEGQMMRAVRANEKLPERFRNAWPVVYAIRNEPPYAYLMEYFPASEGWRSLEDRLYPQNGLSASAPEAVRWVNHILDVLFEGYEASREDRLKPSVQTDYVDRIRGRLADAAAHDPRFRSQPLSINGVRLRPWQEYLDLLDRKRDFVEKISPPFSTIAHGDPNPGNLMLRTALSGVELKLIDPKEWMNGDYLFDIAKLTHFLEGTGPIEKPEEGGDWRPKYEEGDQFGILTYDSTVPTWTRVLVDACLSRVEQFASAHGDSDWQARYELGMASNLLGLPAGRLTSEKNPRPEAALALYGQGMLWLARFCERLHGAHVAPGIPVADRRMVVPEQIASARELIKSRIPHSRESLDRRGFQLLHWDSPRGNEAGKPLELSLEHEARLMPASDRGLAELQHSLALSDGRAAGEHLLPNDPVHGPLLVRRYQRASGAQSVDRYYDLKGVDREKQLIPRMISLRERARTSAFMTWSSADGEKRPLNLELPTVALDDTGVVVRLEFNWVDELARSTDDLAAGASDPAAALNPLFLASLVEGIESGTFAPVIEHTTYREKFEFVSPGTSDAPEQQRFQLNVDHVVAQSLTTNRIGTYTDIDIAPFHRVDDSELQALIAFTQALARRFDLVPVNATKVWRDAMVTGELD